jgi:hypothetical protein
LKIYGHIGMPARQNAIEQRERFMTEQAFNSPQTSLPRTPFYDRTAWGAALYAGKEWLLR